MKILLIDPPYERFIGFKSEWFPMGISYIASYLAVRGHDVAIYHAEHGSDTEYKSVVKYSENFNKYKSAIGSDDHPVWAEVKREISSFCPEVVGISVLTPKVPSAFKIAEICKSINPKMVVVFGNHHPTIKPDEILSSENVDFVIRGEGEETFSSLINNLDSPSPDYHNVAGLSFIDNGKCVSNNDRACIDNLDSLPFPARDRLLNLQTYTPVQLSMVMTSRGCPYNCSFCASHNMWGKKVRFRSVENIINEINELKDSYSVKNITFMDDSFTINRKRVKDLCLAMIETNVNITWSCLTRVNVISDEIIDLMKKAGCTKVDVGIESGTQRILDLIKKDITLEQVRKAAEILRRNKMFWSGFFMFGFPTETENEIFDTINFLKELNPNWANISIFTPYPGTDLYELSLEKGLTNELPDYTLYSHQNSNLRFTDTIPIERFHLLAHHVLSEVHKYNSSYTSLVKRALTRKYHKNPNLLLQDARKVFTWLKK
ncbi:MAG: radical SAM protein [Sedimentisphaerales bacterium]|nr:radical SAM protein [Sedimentisphaerales bacterium]